MRLAPEALGLLTLALAPGALSLGQEPEHPQQQIFELGAFPLESGVTLPDAKLAFVTHGQLNAKAKVLYMPCQTDLYFPMGDALYERRFLRRVKFVPIPSIWGHAAGAGWNPADNEFLNAEIRKALR